MSYPFEKPRNTPDISGIGPKAFSKFGVVEKDRTEESIRIVVGTSFSRWVGHGKRYSKGLIADELGCSESLITKLSDGESTQYKAMSFVTVIKWLVSAPPAWVNEVLRVFGKEIRDIPGAKPSNTMTTMESLAAALTLTSQHCQDFVIDPDEARQQLEMTELLQSELSEHSGCMQWITETRKPHDLTQWNRQRPS